MLVSNSPTESGQQILTTTWYSQVHISQASDLFIRKRENFAFSREVGEAEISTILTDFGPSGHPR